MVLIVVHKSLNVVHQHVYELNLKHVLEAWLKQALHEVFLENRKVSTDWMRARQSKKFAEEPKSLEGLDDQIEAYVVEKLLLLTREKA